MFLNEFVNTLREFLHVYGITADVPTWSDCALGGRFRVIFFSGEGMCALIPDRTSEGIVPVLTVEDFFEQRGVPLELKPLTGKGRKRILILGSKKYILRCRLERPMPKWWNIEVEPLP
ncbi:hypothetical protein A3K34_00550 [candidate division WWE3 bacterium RIFOXYC1_FULL_40_10]|uniref:Uncharacterized protein n=1 Tax=candidate division WWE3 bacterium RIFOXYA2_FULL_46_9 TaxID=1802636 RepID=A0A1F4W3R9_UNCKA|nr:MAG: hypothetical protein A3K58_00550 [candidate division WWE3 bacterium RIFOXYB1_FULL_40_22]OGC61372.1 MAG: hypothetical protein A3K37_00550 [candidate division WWE3 bacterium RIFOXYA1_FULL_40_11]OGC63928.1 MAG: hypothetical protein A2264_02480 [candidate division WWE3 bacterium RIFOXYA2_FULL_46_9]OGC65362.1 MAG: hypothetical protein A2326_04835 [candidate division WWE3 bacterium RIFOXYB2_FULL_41_6]OGC65755.1 MAG: hypothetical protein A3K34_00550 [candidate division WWE3 bacterium RIFOXYC1_